MAARESQTNYNKKNIKRVPLDMQKEYYDSVLKPAADAAGKKVNSLIKEAIDEKVKKETQDPIVVDCLYAPVDMNGYIAEIDGKFYRIRDKKISYEVRRRMQKEWACPDYLYPMCGVEKRGGYSLELQRPITKEELEEVIKKYGAKILGFSEEKKFGIYGKKYEKIFKVIVLDVEQGEAMEAEEELREMGIEAFNGNAGTLAIRVG